ncbi:MAG: EI24 domain-containing protein [Deltaproteobacteria bacterium]|nr:EI24 domain-containing protein [Deltaproteobacteria bacterium]
MYPLIKTIVSIKKANLLGLMLACALLAVVVTVGAVGSVTWITDRFITIERGRLDTLLNWVVGVLTGIGGWFMLPVLTVLISSLFQETAIQRVERVYYPDATHREVLKFWPEIWHDLKFTGWALCLNILLLPLYMFAIGFVASILLNSYLLGREFFESAAGYHLGKTNARTLGLQHRKVMFGGGFMITVMAIVPFLNLFVPILAIVWMVHVYHYIRIQEPQGIQNNETEKEKR